jgi:hypothetical protein
MTELMPCPFCGAKDGDVYPIPAESTHSDPPVNYRQIYCFACDGRGPETLDDEKAGQAWNTRPAPSPSDAACPHGCVDGVVYDTNGTRPDESLCPNPACHGKGALDLSEGPGTEFILKQAPSPSREGWQLSEAIEAVKKMKPEIVYIGNGQTFADGTPASYLALKKSDVLKALSALRPAGDEGQG